MEGKIADSSTDIGADACADTSTDIGADAGPDGADASADASADAGDVQRWVARMRPERGRGVLRRCERLGVRLRGRVRVHGGVLRQPRAAHVRAHDAGADA